MDTRPSKSDQQAEAVLAALASHASVRAYLPDAVGEHEIRRIVAHAQCAATSSNLQLWTAIVVRDEAVRLRLSELCGNQRHIREAPLFIAWCADRSRLDRVSRRRGFEQVTDLTESFLVAAVDTAIAAQNATVAAEALGLGICYIGGLRNNPDVIAEMLGLPDLVMPLFGMTVGWPRRRGSVKPRLDTDVVLHWERYRSSEQDEAAEAEAVARYDQAMRAAGIYSGRQVPDPRVAGETPAIPDEEYGWSEHSSRRAATRSRERLRRIIEERGFPLR